MGLLFFIQISYGMKDFRNEARFDCFKNFVNKRTESVLVKEAILPRKRKTQKRMKYYFRYEQAECHQHTSCKDIYCQLYYDTYDNETHSKKI